MISHDRTITLFIFVFHFKFQIVFVGVNFCSLAVVAATCWATQLFSTAKAMDTAVRLEHREVVRAIRVMMSLNMES